MKQKAMQQSLRNNNVISMNQLNHPHAATIGLQVFQDSSPEKKNSRNLSERDRQNNMLNFQVTQHSLSPLFPSNPANSNIVPLEVNSQSLM